MNALDHQSVPPSTPVYGQQIIWHDRNGEMFSVFFDGFTSAEEALRETLASAKRLGWTPPKWWQWWRFGDRNYEQL